MNKLDTIIKRFAKNSVKIKYYNLQNYFKGATTGYLSVATYYKLALPSLLPNVDRIIFSEADMLNLEDLTEMYNIELKDKIDFLGILDYINHLTQLRDFGLDSDKYIKAIVLYMNLKAMREDSIDKKLNEFIANHTPIFFDQTAINCLCRNNIQNLHYKYNLFAFPLFDNLVELNNQQDIKYRLNQSELYEAYNEPTF